MYKYEVYGHVLESDFALPLREVTREKTDIFVRESTEDDLTKAPHNAESLIRGWFPEVANFSVQNGNEIRVFVLDKSRIGLITEYILGALLSIVMRQRGYLVLHAATLALGDSALILTGDSGWGKSTLSIIMNKIGFEFMGDDVAVVSLENKHCLVLPGPNIAKVSSQAANLISSNKIPKLHKYSNKFRYVARLESTEPKVLRHVYALQANWGRSSKILSCSTTVAFIDIIRHTRVNKVLTNRRYLSDNMDQAKKLLERVKYRKVVREKGLDKIKETVDMILEDLESDL